MALGLRAENPSRAASSVGQSRPASGWRRRWLVAECVTAILAVSVACASASPPNPSWIAGLYDDDDYDDVLRMVADGAGVSGSRASQRVECVVVGLVLGAATGRISRSAAHRQAIRGPPIERPDASADLLLTSVPKPLRRTSTPLASASGSCAAVA
jgi:hypothetical protein